VTHCAFKIFISGLHLTESQLVVTRVLRFAFFEVKIFFWAWFGGFRIVERGSGRIGMAVHYITYFLIFEQLFVFK